MKKAFMTMTVALFAVGILVPDTEAATSAIERKAFRKAKGTYTGKYKSPEFGTLPATTKLPAGKGTAVTTKSLPQGGGFPPVDHIEKWKITRAKATQGGNKVILKGRLIQGPFGSNGTLKANANVKGNKPKLFNSKTTGPDVWGGNGKLTGKQ